MIAFDKEENEEEALLVLPFAAAGDVCLLAPWQPTIRGFG
jgi:hypothetical protein